MKAAQIHKYGTSSVIEINVHAPKPAVKKGQVLVEVHAAGLNPIDYKIRLGYLQKYLKLPFPITLGGDFAGVVKEVGEGVGEFKVGDQVYGQAIVVNGGSGSLAEYVTSNASNTALKPKTVDFITAAALPLASVSALQAIEEHIDVKPGMKILIHGGAGGIGSMAIQLAKLRGAYVATTVRKDDFALVKQLGADRVIDYQSQKFEEILKDYDGVFDTVGGDVTNKSYSVVKKGGILVAMSGQPDQEMAKNFGVRAIGQMTDTNIVKLNRMADLIDSGKIKAVVDKVFPLKQTKEACDYLENGHPKGKVVVRVNA